MGHTIVVRGPMHPDLFDGETPMNIAMEVAAPCRLFRCRCEVRGEVDVFVLATDGDDAADCVDIDVNTNLDDIELDDVHASEVDSYLAYRMITPGMVDEFNARMEGRQ